MTPLVLVALAQAPWVDTPDGGQRAASAWCAGCHEQAARSYAGSKHALARVDPLYLANHAEEPMRWCDGCHAPLGASEDGLGCATCHVRDGAVVTARAPTAQGLAAHRERQDEGLRAEGSCAGCHQVTFPVGKQEPVVAGAFPMQNTVAEWRASGSDRGCPDCHLQDGSHAMTGGHDLERWRATLAVEVTAGPNPGELRLTLTNRGAAHQVPTGDPFRAFLWELCADEGCDVVLQRHRLGRTITPAAQSWRLTDDLTVPARTADGPGRRQLDVRRPPGALAWRLALRFVGDATAQHLPEALTELELASGRLPTVAAAIR